MKFSTFLLLAMLATAATYTAPSLANKDRYPGSDSMLTGVFSGFHGFVRRHSNQLWDPAIGTGDIHKTQLHHGISWAARHKAVAVDGDDDGDDRRFEESHHSHHSGHRSKLCILPGQCFKKTLTCPKNCGKLTDAAGRRWLVKDHFPGQCFLNCKKCIAHCEA